MSAQGKTRAGTWIAATLATLVWSVGASAQAPATLSLDEAIEIARQNNPTFLSTRNDEVAADWGLRSAYGAWLPRASAFSSAGWVDQGAIQVGGVTLAQEPAYYWSYYSATVSYNVDLGNVFEVGRQRANRRAAEAGVNAAELDLETAVTRQYLLALRAGDQVALRQAELERAEENHELAEARVGVGAAIPLEEKQARVDLGRARVALVRAEGDFATQKLRLLQQLGVELDRDVELTTSFEVFEPTWSREAVLEAAGAAHPRIRALEATADAQTAVARSARMDYLPTVNVNANWSGRAREIQERAAIVSSLERSASNAASQCQFENDLNARLTSPIPGLGGDCSQYTVTDADIEQAMSFNDVFPFDFDSDPLSLQLTVSVPIFQGFQRQAQIATANAAADDARHFARGEALRIRADAEAAHLALGTAHDAVVLEEENQSVAAEQLEQARERYRVGLASFVELTEAETLKSQADESYLSAIYDFHTALADLEAAMGRRLRPGG